MKLQYIILSGIAAVLGVLFSSCDDQSDVAEELRPTMHNKYIFVMSNEDVDREYGGLVFTNYDSKLVNVVTLGVPWQITAMPDWITVDRTSGTSMPEVGYYGGDYVKITAMDNNTGVTRSGVISITAFGEGWTLTKNMEVIQFGEMLYLSFSVSSLNVSGDAHTESVDVFTNCPDIKLSCSQSWVTATYDKDAHKVNLTFEENRTNFNRTATVNASCFYRYNDSFTVTQLPSSSE